MIEVLCATDGKSGPSCLGKVNASHLSPTLAIAQALNDLLPAFFPLALFLDLAKPFLFLSAALLCLDLAPHLDSK